MRNVLTGRTTRLAGVRLAVVGLAVVRLAVVRLAVVGVAVVRVAGVRFVGVRFAVVRVAVRLVVVRVLDERLLVVGMYKFLLYAEYPETGPGVSCVSRWTRRPCRIGHHRHQLDRVC